MALAHRMMPRAGLAGLPLAALLAGGLAWNGAPSAADMGRLPPPPPAVDALEFVASSRAQSARVALEANIEGDRFFREGRLEEARHAYERALRQGDPEQGAHAERQLAVLSRRLSSDPTRPSTGDDMRLRYLAGSQNTERMLVDDLSRIRDRIQRAGAPSSGMASIEIPPDTPKNALPAYALQEKAADAQWRLNELRNALGDVSQAEVRLSHLPPNVDRPAFQRELSDLRLTVEEMQKHYSGLLETASREAGRIMVQLDEGANAKAQQHLVIALAKQAASAMTRGEYQAAMVSYQKIQELQPSYPDIVRLIDGAHRRMLDTERRDRDTNFQSRRARLEVDAYRKGLVTNEHMQYPPNWIQLNREADERMARLSSSDDPQAGRLRGLLRQQVSYVSFDDTPIVEVLEMLSNSTDTPVSLVATDSARTLNPSVTFNLQNMTLEQVLNWVKHYSGLSWRTTPNSDVEFYDPEVASGSVVRRVYNITDLMRRVPRPSGQDPYGILTVADSAEGDDTDDDDEDTIEDIINEVLGNEFGDGVHIWRELMVARLTPEDHVRLEELLAKMRSARNLQVHVAARFIRINSGTWEEFSNYFDRLQGGNPIPLLPGGDGSYAINPNVIDPMPDGGIPNQYMRRLGGTWDLANPENNQWVYDYTGHGWVMNQDKFDGVSPSTMVFQTPFDVTMDRARTVGLMTQISSFG